MLSPGGVFSCSAPRLWHRPVCIVQTLLMIPACSPWQPELFIFTSRKQAFLSHHVQHTCTAHTAHFTCYKTQIMKSIGGSTKDTLRALYAGCYLYTTCMVYFVLLQFHDDKISFLHNIKDVLRFLFFCFCFIVLCPAPPPHLSLSHPLSRYNVMWQACRPQFNTSHAP